ncbi:MAG: hypothetical protein IPK32_23325 [Verrucomicrobiaceae bacterium]|nr:hypothetical protein [Verrucomicrobiaceae bacterium]
MRKFIDTFPDSDQICYLSEICAGSPTRMAKLEEANTAFNKANFPKADKERLRFLEWHRALRIAAL